MKYLLQHILKNSTFRYPENTAVWARGRSVSYRRLEESSTQLSHLLRRHGVRKGDRVGLFLPKCVESVVSMFAVLKAGAVYVPLDPQAPPDRIAYILADCDVRSLITNQAKLSILPEDTIRRLRCVVLADSGNHRHEFDEERIVGWSALSGCPVSEPVDPSGIENDLAYILYTSGSTGKPKGVMVSHRNALTFIEWCAATFHVRSGDRLSNHAPLHFDLSVFDIYNAIEAGAAVYLITEETTLFPSVLAKFIEDWQITIWYSVPSALILLLLHSNLTAERLRNLRTILFAGEVFPLKYLRQLVELAPQADFYNLYGPTETNVCTYYKVERAVLGGMVRLPIGRACQNTEVFAIDDQGQLATPGALGELCVRGPSVTNGYWGDRAKTDQVLIPNPLQKNFSEKIYRTGDLVVSADGNYCYLGRRDHMIKSRGYRIELGEIETTLLTHPEVKEVAVLAVPDAMIGNRIKAVVAARSLDSVTTVELQQYCSARIPQYMVPEFFEFRHSLPKTSTGKIDRVGLAHTSAAAQ